MNETSKNKWIAVVVAVVIAAFFFGGILLYSFNRNVENSLTNTATSTLDFATYTSPTNISTSTNQNIMTTTTTPEGLIIEESRVGTGAEAQLGKTIAVNYIGTLENGTKFDSSYDRGQPIVFTLGTGQVIRGWDQGIAGMKVGGKRTLIIPPALAYGNQAVGGVIPANSTLIFEVELVGVQK